MGPACFSGSRRKDWPFEDILESKRVANMKLLAVNHGGHSIWQVFIKVIEVELLRMARLRASDGGMTEAPLVSCLACEFRQLYSNGI